MVRFEVLWPHFPAVIYRLSGSLFRCLTKIGDFFWACFSVSLRYKFGGETPRCLSSRYELSFSARGSPFLSFPVTFSNESFLIVKSLFHFICHFLTVTWCYMLYINWFIRELTKLLSYPKYVVGNFEWGLDTMIPKARWMHWKALYTAF